MTKWLVKWKVTEQYLSLPSTERMKLDLSSLGMVKADIDAGLIDDWGYHAGGGEGYAIFECSEIQVYEALLKYVPYVSCEVIAVIPFEQRYESVKKLAAAARR